MGKIFRTDGILFNISFERNIMKMSFFGQHCSSPQLYLNKQMVLLNNFHCILFFCLLTHMSIFLVKGLILYIKTSLFSVEIVEDSLSSQSPQ